MTVLPAYRYRDLVGNRGMYPPDVSITALDPSAPIALPDGTSVPKLISRGWNAVCVDPDVLTALGPQWGVTDYTVILWIFRQGATNPGTAFSEYLWAGLIDYTQISGVGEWTMRPPTSGGAGVTISLGNRTAVCALADNDWTMIAFTCQSSLGSGAAPMKPYVNGVAGTPTSNVTPYAWGAGAAPALTWGNRAVGNAFSMAAVTRHGCAHLSIFHRELSAAELLALYQEMT